MAEYSPQQPLPPPRQLTVNEPDLTREPRPTLRLPTPRKSMTLPPDVDPGSMPVDVPNPSHRHGAPSGPWPWLDLHASIDPREITDSKVTLKRCSHHQLDGDKHCWCNYPQSLYPNWTPIQQKASRITDALGSKHGWRIYPLVVSNNGIFKSLDYKSGRYNEVDDFWNELRLPEKKPKDCHIYTLFVENMAGPIMQMLGTNYNIEPFFFSSSFGWIPSRYQESALPKESDHITITLTFIHCTDDFSDEGKDGDLSSFDSDHDIHDQSQRNIAIKTNQFLGLRSSGKILFSDIISLHMIRHPTDGHTIISYHAPRRFRATSAKKLRERFQLTGSSVYWSKIFERSKDPTFAFLSLLWYPLYAWDESLEALYSHICFLESNVLENTQLDFTQELHQIRAHLLHYTDLIADFKKTVEFIQETRYPALENEKYFTPKEKKESVDLMHKECKNLLDEIARLDRTHWMQHKRLTNVMQLGFNTVNILDSRRMQALTEITVRDSAAMKQIAYLTMVFLPASFVANVFGMNVTEINPDAIPALSHYFAAVFPLTIFVIWIIIALQVQLKEPVPLRHRHPPSKQPPRLAKTSHNINSPSGYDLRPAYASTEGDIIVATSEPEFEGQDDTYDSHEKHDDDAYGSYHHYSGEYREVPQASMWKRLLWPIYLTLYYLAEWHKSRERGPKPKQKSPGQTDSQGKRNLTSFSLPFFNSPKTRNGMTPAARFAADIRSQHSGSSKSAERVEQPPHVLQSPRLHPVLRFAEDPIQTLQNPHLED